MTAFFWQTSDFYDTLSLTVYVSNGEVEVEGGMWRMYRI